MKFPIQVFIFFLVLSRAIKKSERPHLRPFFSDSIVAKCLFDHSSIKYVPISYGMLLWDADFGIEVYAIANRLYIYCYKPKEYS